MRRDALLSSSVRLCFLIAILAAPGAASAQTSAPPSEIVKSDKAADDVVADIKTSTIWNGRKEGRLAWFQARACTIPSPQGPLVFMTEQTVAGSDYYGSVHWAVCDPTTGKWTEPKQIPGSEWFKSPDGYDVGACDFVPEYHGPTNTTLVMGHNVFYRNGSFFSPQPSRCPVYLVRDAKGNWSPLKKLAWDNPKASYIYTSNCSQRITLDDGKILVPVTYGDQEARRSVTTLLCSFDGKTLAIEREGKSHQGKVKRGFLEPSLAKHGGVYYMTIRAEDDRGHVSTSSDGLDWSEPQAWKWDDGQPLVTSTTQQRWLPHREALYLVYTRKTDENAKVVRWRAPLYMAQVDVATMRLIRKTERVVFPMIDDGGGDKRGAHVARLGNFHTTAVSPDESWITVGESRPWAKYHGDTLLARVRWKVPNADAPTFQTSHAESWKVGCAKTNITPERLMWMSGYAARKHPAEGKGTDLWAKVVVIEDPSGNRIAWATIDLVGIDRNLSGRIKQAVETQFKLPKARVALSTTHTHSGPVLKENLAPMYFLDEKQTKLVADYAVWFEKRVIDAFGRAVDDLAPAELSWGTGHCTLAVNRRNNPEKDVPQLREQGALKGPVDHDAPILCIRGANGQLKALVCGYACHATTLDGYEWSGDWPGYAQIELERNHPSAQAMIWAGCGGDQNPLPRRKTSLAVAYGKQYADAVEKTLADESALAKITGTLATEYREIGLAYDRVPTKEELDETIEKGDKYDVAQAKILLKQLKQEGEIAASYPYPIQTWRLGDGPTLSLLGGEVVVDYALRIKAEFAGKRNWVAAYTNDVMAYIPSRRVWSEGGYEGGGAMRYYGLPSRWSENVERDVMTEAARQINAVSAAAK